MIEGALNEQFMKNEWGTVRHLFSQMKCIN